MPRTRSTTSSTRPSRSSARSSRTSSPNYQNQLGFDAGVLAVPAGLVPNGSTSAKIDLSTVQDRYLPGVVYFRTDIYAPEMVLHKTVTDVNGGEVNPGDVLQYDVGATNTGQSIAYDSRINDAIPPHTTYLPGSLKIVTSPGSGVTGAKTDATDLDQAEYDGGPNEVRFRVGTGATALGAGPPKFPEGGGEIAPNESFSVQFKVVVGADTPDGTQILNTAVLSSKDENGIDYTSIASAPAAVTVRGTPDVTIDKSHTGVFVRGQQGTFKLVVSNVGGRATSGTVVINDTLPNGLTVVSASGSNWSCSVDTTANSLHCERSDSLAAGTAYEPVNVLVNVLESAPDTIVNTGVTGGGGETNTSNNRDDDTVTVTSIADVAIVKSVTPTTTPPGKNVTYTMVVTNNGPSTAKAVQVSDPLPPGITFVSVTPAACGLAGTTVKCALGDLAKGQSVTITLVSGIPLSLANKTKTNTATVSSPTPDSDLTNNHDDATVKITGAPPSKITRGQVGEAERGRAHRLQLADGGLHDRAQGALQDRRQAGRRVRHAAGEHGVRLRAGCDVQQRPRLLAPRPRQGGLDNGVHDHGQGGQGLRRRLAQEHRGRNGRQRARRSSPTRPSTSPMSAARSTRARGGVTG